MTGSAPEVLVLADADALAEAVAAQLLARLADTQATRGQASVVLTGGGIGIAVLDAVRRSPDRDTVTWNRVHVWWGDERYVAADDPQRNDLQAREALLDHLELAPGWVHAMPAAETGDLEDVDRAAARFAVELATSEGAAFDVLLLGLGTEGHTASIFPGSPASNDDRPVFAVRDCPKPPPTRITLGLSTLNTAREIWLVVSGPDKATAVAAAIAGDADLPAGAVHGREKTRWLLDADAASEL